MSSSKKMDFEAEAGQPASDALKKFGELITEVDILAAQMEELAANTKEVTTRYNDIKMNKLPKLMAEMQTDEWVDSKTGIRVKINSFVSGSLPKAEPMRKEAIDWLAANDGDNLMTAELSVEFKKSEHNLALSVKADLEKQNLQPTLSETIHPATLQKWARERLANGEDVPAEKLGLFMGKAADITLPKPVGAKKGSRGKKL